MENNSSGAPVSYYNSSTQGNSSSTSINSTVTGSGRNAPAARRVSGDLMSARRSSEVLSNSLGQGSVFDAFVGAKDGQHFLVPDMPYPQN